ncbi:ADP-heptose--LPS heptosyltransferase [uncultured Desulfobacterium sp.]|uniref:lipopolysaccharide heptosyltransferase II n=1 Tax=uncultured Desulfobacterium sp. TaxID=201089 RepID=A0A445MRZ4_9BACT|nr:ADP-heptose--LPS heptosyltransferase [uncultured Desulfobacterium sp.]
MKENPASVNSILVRCPNWVGDIVMATPVFACLRENFPNALIAACIKQYAQGIIEGSPWFDRIIACNDKTYAGFKQTVKDIRRIRPDMAIVLPNSIRSFLSVWLGGVRNIYGYKRNFRSLFLAGGPSPIRDIAGKVRPMAMLDYYLELCRFLDLKLPAYPRPELFVSDSLRAKGERLLRSYQIEPNDIVVGLNPGASFGSSKCWPAEYFAELAGLIKSQFECKIILFVGPGEEGIAEAIVKNCRVPVVNTGPDRVDLATLKPLIKRCSILITNDTGPRHFAVAFGIPVVVIMGPTNPLYTSANLDKTVVIRRELDCSPCHKKVCPTDHRCMTEIRPEMVFGEVKKMLGRPKKG